MTVKKASIFVPVSMLVIVLGVYLTHNFYWAKDKKEYWSIIGVCLSLLGLFPLSLSITRLIFPVTTDFGFAILLDKQNSLPFKKAIGLVKANAIINTFTFLCFFFVAILLFLFYSSKRRYEKTELNKYGLIQKVRIREIEVGRRSRFVRFDIYYQNKTLSNKLYHETLTVGDSATLIFSTNNPDIIEWLYDYKQRD